MEIERKIEDFMASSIVWRRAGTRHSTGIALFNFYRFSENYGLWLLEGAPRIVARARDYHVKSPFDG